MNLIKRFTWWLSLAGVLGAAFASASAASSPPTTLEKPFFVETSDKMVYHSVEDDHGGFYVVWSRGSARDGYSLIGQHVSAGGNALWPAPGNVIATDLADSQEWGALTDGKGSLILTWIEGMRVHAQRFDSEGKTLWPAPFSLSPSTTTAHWPAGTADADGGVFLVWSEPVLLAVSSPTFALTGKTPHGPDRLVLMIQHLNSDGRLLWPSGGLRVSLRPSDQRHPSIIPDGFSGAVIAWNDFRESASQLQIQRLDYHGTRPWGLAGVVVTAPAGTDQSPVLEPAVNGRSVAAWMGTQSGASRFLLQSVDRRGNLEWLSSGLGVSYGVWDQWNPVLSGAEDGMLWVGWGDHRDDNHWQVFLEKLDHSGKPVWKNADLQLAVMEADQGNLALTDDGQKGIFAAWADNRSGSNGIYLQEINADGQLLLPAGGVTVAEGLRQPLPPQLVSLAAGQAAVILADNTTRNHWSLFWKILPARK